MKIAFKKVLAAVFAGSLLFGALTGCNFGTGGGAGGSSGEEKLNHIDYTGNSVQMASALKIGWNLGNALDASSCDSWAYSAGNSLEYSWLPHKQPASRDLIKAVADAGFKTIRIPVSWHNHMNKTSYKIDSVWMNRVKELVDWSLEEGMCVIINIHHDNLTEEQIKSHPGFALSKDADIQKKSKAYIKTVWEQISATFADYDNRLVFELLNEPRCIGESCEWGFYSNLADSKAWNDIITSYEQVGLNAIRKSGGYNTSRYVMAPAYAASDSTLSYYKLPEDCVDKCLMLSVHAYTPSDFCLEGETTDYSANKTRIENAISGQFTSLKNNYVSKGIGVVIGEASASDKDNLSSRVSWANYFFEKAKAAGTPVVVWDNEQAVAMGATAGGENHGYFNRVTCEQTWPTMIAAMMDKVGTDVVTVPETPVTPIGPATVATPGTSDDPTDTPEAPAGEVVIFDASTASAPAGTSIVTIGGVKYLKVTPNGYETNFEITPVNVSSGKKIVVTMKADADTTGVQAKVKAMIGWDAICAENTDPTMSPLSATAKDYESTIVTSGAVSRIQPMVQNTSNWSARSDTAIYISKIVAK